MGVHEYVPVLFDEHYYCISFAMVHSMLVGNRDDGGGNPDCY